jgi:hypothetical protein
MGWGYRSSAISTAAAPKQIAHQRNKVPYTQRLAATVTGRTAQNHWPAVRQAHDQDPKEAADERRQQQQRNELKWHARSNRVAVADSSFAPLAGGLLSRCETCSDKSAKAHLDDLATDGTNRRDPRRGRPTTCWRHLSDAVAERYIRLGMAFRMVPIVQEGDIPMMSAANPSDSTLRERAVVPPVCVGARTIIAAVSRCPRAEA